MNKLIDAFIGPIQSKYAAVAIISAVIIVCITIIFSNDNIPLDKKLVTALILFVVSLPTILYMLFQMSCIVTGSGESTWWCGVYAWFLVLLIVIYSISVVIMAIYSVVGAKNMAAVEEFYANKQAYERFATKMTEKVDEEVMHEKHESFAEQAPTETDHEKYLQKMDGIVLPTVEKFTSCGTVVPPQ